MKRILVCGAGGFIGGHLVKKLKKEGYWVRGVDLKHHEYCETHADEFIIGDLRNPVVVSSVVTQDIDEIYQLAADMGGAGFVFTGENDADIMHNSALINLNMAHECVKKGVKKIFYSSSACTYPKYNQTDPDNPKCNEDSAYPAAPDSEYGWEKLFSERLYLAFARNYGLNVSIARYHNIFGPEGTWNGGREKAPAAMCRKAILASPGDSIEVWGDGKQTRSFLYVDECVEATLRLMNSDFSGPVNIGSEEMIAINNFAQMAIDISEKDLKLHNIQGKEFEEKYGFKCPVGVRGRNSDNDLVRKKLGWDYSQSLRVGMEKTYAWINDQSEELESDFERRLTTSWAEQDIDRQNYLAGLNTDELKIERDILSDTIKKLRSFSSEKIKKLRNIHYTHDVIPKMDVGGGRYQHRATFIYEKGIAPILEKNPEAKILNVGSGTGCLSYFFWIYKNRLPLKNCKGAVDVFPSYLSSHALYGIDTYLMNFEKENITDFIDQKYDIILCTEVIEHLTQHAEDKLLSFFKKSLNKGGSIFFTYPGPKHCFLDNNSFGHVRVPSAKDIKKSLENNFKKYDDGFFKSVSGCPGKPKTPSFYQQFIEFRENNIKDD